MTGGRASTIPAPTVPGTTIPGTVAGTLVDLGRRLAAVGIASPALDARLLLIAATGLSHEALIAAPDRPLRGDEVRRLEDLARRRLAREPLSRVIGEREFYGRRFTIGPASLDPRPDTETLVERALSLAATRTAPLDILDLGTGSGAILVTLLAELPGARGIGTDVSAAALAEARINVLSHGVGERAGLVRADWCTDWDWAAGRRFDLIVANPPYIPSREIDGLEPEVRDHDPRQALDGGADGLDAYRAIAAGAGRLLAPGGLVALEIGAGQESGVLALLTGHGWDADSTTAICRDLAGHVRVLAFCQRGSLPLQQKKVGFRAATR
jgi:release factor glutamine methyltransferase